MIIEKIRSELERLSGRIYQQPTDVTGWRMKRCRYRGPGEYEYLDADWRPIATGAEWGGERVTAFLENTITLQPDFKGARVVLQLVTGGEGLVSINGRPYAGLDSNRSNIVLTEAAAGDETFHIQLEVYCKAINVWASPTLGTKLHRSVLVTENRPARSYYALAKAAFDCAVEQPSAYLKESLLDGIYRSLLTVQYEPEQFQESLAEAVALLRRKLAENSFKLPVEMVFAGHSHIDVAWMWPLEETVRKCSRTFSTVLRLMEQYPFFQYTQSMPQLYEYVKEYYPQIYAQVKARIAEGRWETVGGMWVEPDCNLISGESFVRQILYGKQFYQAEFGTDTDVCFLPDTFGFAGSMPQILKKAGFKYFFTSKLAWNENNTFPYSVFHWEGIDGTKILAAMIEMGCDLYNGIGTLQSIFQTLDKFQPKDGSAAILYTYGFGDGGGGVTPEMLDTIACLDDIPGTPRIKTGSARDYFQALEAKDAQYPVWNGELYFEKHRGTYTTQSRNKRFNRKAEYLYRNAEILAALARIQAGQYPQSQLSRGWKKILLNQFHDILPGTAITEAYETSRQDYREVFALGDQGVERALSLLVQSETATDTLTVFNTLSWERTGPVEYLPETAADGWEVRDRDGRVVPSQVSQTDAGRAKLVFLAEQVPAMGYKTFQISKTGRNDNPAADSLVSLDNGYGVENQYLKVQMDSEGCLTGIYDKKAGREVLKPGRRGNVLQIFEDLPVAGVAKDAWTVDRKREDRGYRTPETTSIRVRENGAIYTRFTIEKRFQESSFRQDLIIYHYAPLLEFKTTADWHEDHKMLRVLFPVDVHATKATYDIAYGTVERPTHRSTSYDQAQFEVSAHKWADLSEGNYGVSLMNDCKYGYSILDGEMQLSLLRATVFPDTVADRGTHEFSYYLYPHGGQWRGGQVVQRAFEVNVPLLSSPGCSAFPDYSLIRTDRENVIVDCLKRAEDSEDLILRLYETYDQHDRVQLKLGFAPAAVWECDLLERPLRQLELKERTLEFAITPYEIKTFRLKI